MKIVKSEEKEWIKSKNYYKKILFSEEDLKSKGNIVQIVKVDGKTNIEPHYHKKTSEVFFVLKGNGIIFVGKDKQKRKIGDVIFCEPGEIHGVINDMDEEFVWLVFKINFIENDTFWE
jgi:quercetin dioxygenase-like cupin family protein